MGSPTNKKAKKVRADFHPLTKKSFEQILKKASQPVSEWKHGQEATETMVSHPSDGYSDKCKSQDKTVDKECLPSD
jgi:hypothetical protein